MKFSAAIAMTAFTSTATAAQLRGRELDDTCGQLSGCQIINLSNNVRTPLTSSSIDYSIDSDSRYTVLCETTGPVNYAKFTYNDDVQSHFDAPLFYLKGNDKNSDYINDEEWLKVPGPKEIDFSAHIWSLGDETPCVSQRLSVNIVGNILENGSFESNPMPFNSFKFNDASVIKGWKSLNGNGIELWGTGWRNVYAASGNGGTFMEMDQHSGGKIDGIYQDVVTEAGSFYKLSFYMRARGENLASSDEELIVEWNGVQISADGYNNKVEGDWTMVEIVVRGTGSDRLTLRESSVPAANDSTGPFLDEVSLVLLPGKKNLLANASFEQNTVPAGRWSIIPTASLKGWTALNPRYGIELWGNGHNRVTAAKGNGETFAELDLHAARGTDGFYQNIQTEKNKMYLLTFFVRSRRHNVVSDDEAVVVEWNGVKTSPIGYHAAGEGVWTYIEVMLEGTGDVDELKFRESVTRSANNGYGALLDEVSFIEL